MILSSLASIADRRASTPAAPFVAEEDGAARWGMAGAAAARAAASAAVAPATGASAHVRLELLGGELGERLIAIVGPFGLIPATIVSLRGEVNIL